MEHIGIRIKQFREAHRLTQADVFRDTGGPPDGVKQTTLSSIESGTEPKYGVVAALLRAYPDLSPEWLLNGVGSMLRGNRTLTPVVAEPQRAAGPYLSHTNLSAEEIGELLQKVARLEARAEAAEKEAAKYWSVVERHAGKKTEGNLITAAAEPQAVYAAAPPTPEARVVIQGFSKKPECVVRQLVPASDSVEVTPSYPIVEKLG